MHLPQFCSGYNTECLCFSGTSLPTSFLARTEWQFVSVELRRLCQAGFLEVAHSKPHCVLPLQVTPKKSGGFRLITDCHFVNSFLSVPSFSQHGIKDVVEQIEVQDKLSTIDLRDGFFHIDVLPACHKFLGIYWKGVFYQWTCLPFGLALSPYFFNKCLRPVLTFLRSQGLKLALWVDDFLHIAKESVTADRQDTLLHTLSDLGWQVNWKKSQLHWSTSITYMGYKVWSSFLNFKQQEYRVVQKNSSTSTQRNF